jgi:predicted metalloprotease with PDZ domain
MSATIRLSWALALTAVATAAPVSPLAAQQAQYEVTVGRDPRVLTVTATVPAHDGVLIMTPWGYPPTVKRGWAAFVEGLEVRSGGRPVTIVPTDSTAWRVDAPDGATLQLAYTVRLTHDQYDWDPAGGVDARPAALDSAVVWMTKAFIIAPPIDVLDAMVRFNVPSGDRVSAPWQPVTGRDATFRTTSLEELYNNTVVIGRHIHRELRAGDLQVVLAVDLAMAAEDAGITDVLSRAIATYREILGGPVRSRYLVALRRDAVDDGEAFTSSFVQVFRESPEPASAIVWANTLVHELFHVSTAQLVAVDQATVEWFNEGFTEYMASRTLVRLGAISPATWRQKLAFYLSRAESTRIWDRERPTLTAAGAAKGRNWRWIYGGGAALAAHLDIMLRVESEGQKSLDDVFRVMHRRFGVTGRQYTGADVAAAVAEVSGRDWSAFFATYVDGPAPSLPLPEALARTGIRTSQFADEFYLEPVADPTPAQQALLRAVMGPLR